MALSELTHEQQLALVGLVEAVVTANEIVSEDELRGIGRIVEELTEPVYRLLMREGDERFQDISDLKDFLETIDDQSAREEIYGTVWEASVADPDVNHTETELLDWLRQSWAIED